MLATAEALAVHQGALSLQELYGAHLSRNVMAIKHAKLSTQPDSGNPDLIGSNDWNDDHDLSGMVLADVPGLTNALDAASGMLSPIKTAEISVTTTATLTIDRMHVCFGTSADYTVTLPAASGNAGRLVGLRMAPGLTRWVSLKGNAAELIDGSNTRKMWTNETALLYCNGSGWVKLAGRAVPVHTLMKRSTTTALAAGSWSLVPTTTSVSDNTSALAVPAADVANGRVRILRASRYLVHGFVSASAFATGKLMGGGAIMDNGSNATPSSPTAWGVVSAPTSGLVAANGSSTFVGNTSLYFYLVGFNEDTVSRNTQASLSVEPHISVLEVPDW